MSAIGVELVFPRGVEAAQAFAAGLIDATAILLIVASGSASRDCRINILLRTSSSMTRPAAAVDQPSRPYWLISELDAVVRRLESPSGDPESDHKTDQTERVF